MRVAVLPFNAAEGAKPQLGRQISAFIGEQLRSHAQADIQTVSFLTQVEQEGSLRTAFVNIGDAMLEPEQLKDLFDQSEADLSLDGMLRQSDGEIDLTVRFTHKASTEGGITENFKFKHAEIFTVLHTLVKKLADEAEIGLPEFLAGEKMEFGTDDAESFLEFLEGYDALNYIQQSNGAVALEFNPEPAIATLLSSIERDKEFEGPYQVLVGLCRACANFRIGTFEVCEKALTTASELIPEDFGAFFALGELYQTIGNLPRAVDFFEKAVQVNPEDPALYNRLGNAQMLLGMPVNAERNFKKAIEMEGPDKPSMDFLAGVLAQTNRGHEIPALWKGLIEADNQNAAAHAKYAISLIQNGRTEDGEKAFDDALTVLEDNTVVKRFYAPYLAQKGDLDRAMDFYEDCLDTAPADVQLLWEYAETLRSAEREFEIPAVLQSILKSNRDPNMRAQSNAWLIELEQPKRVESVMSAQQKLDAGDVDGAIRELKPLRNWLADYWKLWALLSSAFNRAHLHAEAEDSAKRLLEMFPGCEPAFGELREALNGQGRNDEAYQMMQFAASQNSQSLGIFVNLAIAAKRAGHDEEAKNLAGQIKEALKDNAEVMNELAPVLAEIDA